MSEFALGMSFIAIGLSMALWGFEEFLKGDWKKIVKAVYGLLGLAVVMFGIYIFQGLV
jgi:hypothetical protein